MHQHLMLIIGMTDDNAALLEEKEAAEMKFMEERGEYPTTNNMNCPGI
jgi:hypothetical protein